MVAVRPQIRTLYSGRVRVGRFCWRSGVSSGTFSHAKDEEEAIAIANDSPFGLGGSIYTKNIELGKRVASRIETGMVFINYPCVSTADLPFGGIKRSGYGKELSDLGIQEFVNKKLICASNGVSLVA